MLAPLTSLSEVTVDRLYADKVQQQIKVPAGRIARLPLGAYGVGDKVAVVIDVQNAVYKDITACLVWGSGAANAYRPGARCDGYVKATAPFTLQERTSAAGDLFLVLDNSYAALITKQVWVNTVFEKELPDNVVDGFKQMLGEVQRKMSSAFKNADVDLHLKSCGQRNAFSEVKTAAITLCNELVFDLLKERNTGALAGIFLHEYGHSMLNRWGEPGASEEDMADQFAAAMLLRDGDNGRRLLMQWIEFWKAQNSVAEANAALRYGDTHSLSIQRARNLQQILNLPHDFMRRWNKMLYRHMTEAELDRVLARPSVTDDLDLARQAKAGAL